MLELREEARQGFADVLGVDPVHIALVESTSRGCATVLAGLGLTGEDEVITTDQEHFGLTGPLYATGARVLIVDADEDAILGGDHAEDEARSRPRTCSGRPAGASTCTA